MAEAELSEYAEWSRKLNAEVTVELVLPCTAPIEQELAEAAALMRRVRSYTSEPSAHSGTDDALGAQTAGGVGPPELRRALRRRPCGFSRCRDRRWSNQQLHRDQH